jgi:hypothetical protein
MRHFVSQLIWILGLVAFSCAGIIAIGNSGKDDGANSYLAAAIDKEALLARTPSPRLIFVGGSNLAMGLDSERVARETGMNVVNMGVNAGFGLRFMLSEVKPALRAGDVVVLIPEYEQYLGHLDGGITLIELLSIYPAGVRYLESPNQIAKTMVEFPAFLQGTITDLPKRFRPRDASYANRSSYNSYGDITVHLDHASPVDVSAMTLFNADEKIFDDQTIGVIQVFDAFAQRTGARLIIMFPALPEKQYSENRERLDFVANRLREAHVPVIGTPKDFVFPVAYFFDTVYHLNRVGRTARTGRVIEFLQPLIR